MLNRRRKKSLPLPPPESVQRPWYVGVRTTWNVPDLDIRNGVYPPNDMTRVRASYATSNLVGSLVEGEIHLPVFDIDFPAALVESTTPGHYHLYLNKPVTWRKYRKLLRAMHSAGLIEHGFCNLSIARGCAFVRRPGVRKGQGLAKGMKAVDI